MAREGVGQICEEWGYYSRRVGIVDNINVYLVLDRLFVSMDTRCIKPCLLRSIPTCLQSYRSVEVCSCHYVREICSYIRLRMTYLSMFVICN